MNDMTVPAPDARIEPPVNYEAEQALLGAILTNNRAYDDVAGFLSPEHFAHPSHADIFAAAKSVIETGKRANATTLRAMFHNDGTLAKIGGVAYLASLMTAATTIAAAKDYGKVILDMAKRRAAMAAGQQLVSEACEVRPDQDAQAILHQHGKVVDDILAAGEAGRGLVSLDGGMDEALRRTEAAYKNEGRLTGVPTGLADLDRKTGGLQPSNLIIIGARPSMGKTTMACSMMLGAAQAGKCVAFFSLEMSAEEVSWLLLANLTGIPAEDQRAGRIDGNAYSRLDAAARKLRSLPFLIDDTPAQPVTALRAKARQMKRRGKLDLIVVDYLQLIRPENRRGNRTEDVSEISAGLKALAKELAVPVVALSQLSRAVEMRENKRPILADLRESGGIEQDADVVAFIYREEYYLSREKPGPRASAETRLAYDDLLEQSRGVAEIIMPKVRMGATGTVKLACDLASSRFYDLPKSSTAYQEDMGL